MKSKRQQAILKIISENDICTQEELQKKLEEQGFNVTQATVSRDIKNLKLIKTSSQGQKYKYAQKNEDNDSQKGIRFQSAFLAAVISVDYAQNIVCVKCHVGMGNAACAVIDNMNLGDVVGTIAGDDTIFILLKDTQQAVAFVDKLNEMLGR